MKIKRKKAVSKNSLTKAKGDRQRKNFVWRVEPEVFFFGAWEVGCDGNDLVWPWGLRFGEALR